MPRDFSRLAGILLLVCLPPASPASAQEPIVPFGDVVLLAEDCTVSPVIVESGGQVVAVWSETDRIAARVGPALAELGPEAEIHSPASYVPSVAALAQPGGFVAAWTSFLPEDNAVMVLFQRFGLDLQPRGTPVVLESVEGFYQRPQLADLPDGSFVLAYARELEGNAVSVRARRFFAEGAALTPTIEVGIGIRNARDLSLASGDSSFALTWTALVGMAEEARMRVVADDGQLLGGEIVLGPGFARAVPLAEGFLVLRVGGNAIYGRKIGLDGSPLAPEALLANLPDFPFDLLASGGDDAVWLAWITNDSQTLVASLLDPAAMSASPSTTLFSLGAPPDGNFLIASALRAMAGRRFVVSWQRALNSVILPTPCDFGLSIHAGIFGSGPPAVEVPLSSPAGALLLAGLLAAAGLAMLARSR